MITSFSISRNALPLWLSCICLLGFLLQECTLLYSKRSNLVLHQRTFPARMYPLHKSAVQPESLHPWGLTHLRSMPGGVVQTTSHLTVRNEHHIMNQFMDQGAKNWLFKYARKQYWRVAAWVDFDDLIQDGYVEYCEVLKRYPQAVEPSHKMRLFQLCFRSRIEDLVRANTKQVDDARSDIVEVYDSPAMIVPDMSNLQALLIKAPKEIKAALALMLDEKAREELVKPFAKYENGRRETLNDRFTRLLGIDNKTDIVGSMRSYFA